MILPGTSDIPRAGSSDFPRHLWASIQPANLEESNIVPADSLAVDCRFSHAPVMKPLLFVLLVLPGILLAQGGLPNQPYIYVEGKAEIEKPADIVTLRFDLVTRNIDQAKANQEVQTKATKVFALLDSKKIAATM